MLEKQFFFFSDDETKNQRYLSDTCKPNEIDERQYCRCPRGERILEFKSTHDNGPEDRIWDLKCAPIPSGEMCVSSTLSLGLPV